MSESPHHFEASVVWIAISLLCRILGPVASLSFLVDSSNSTTKYGVACSPFSNRPANKSAAPAAYDAVEEFGRTFHKYKAGSKSEYQ